MFHRSYFYDVKSILDKRPHCWRKTQKNGRQTIFFTLLNPFGEHSDEEAFGKSLTLHRKVHYRSFWKHHQDAVFGVKLSQAQDQGLQFWQTKSFAILVNDHVQTERICRVISENGEQILFERMPTPRPAPKIILKSRWRIEQEQYSESASSDTWKDWRDTQSSEQENEMKIETLEEQCSSSSWQQQANSDIPDFEIDLRIEGVPGDIVQKDEKRINENLEKSRIGSRAESTREDLSKEYGDLTFSEVQDG